MSHDFKITWLQCNEQSGGVQDSTSEMCGPIQFGNDWKWKFQVMWSTMESCSSHDIKITWLERTVQAGGVQDSTREMCGPIQLKVEITSHVINYWHWTELCTSHDIKITWSEHTVQAGGSPGLHWWNVWINTIWEWLKMETVMWSCDCVTDTRRTRDLKITWSAHTMQAGGVQGGSPGLPLFFPTLAQP